jgi:hypothetical protein
MISAINPLSGKFVPCVVKQCSQSWIFELQSSWSWKNLSLHIQAKYVVTVVRPRLVSYPHVILTISLHGYESEYRVIVQHIMTSIKGLVLRLIV